MSGVPPLNNQRKSNVPCTSYGNCYFVKSCVNNNLYVFLSEPIATGANDLFQNLLSKCKIFFSNFRRERTFYKNVVFAGQEIAPKQFSSLNYPLSGRQGRVDSAAICPKASRFLESHSFHIYFMLKYCSKL